MRWLFGVVVVVLCLGLVAPTAEVAAEEPASAATVEEGSWFSVIADWVETFAGWIAGLGEEEPPAETTQQSGGSSEGGVEMDPNG